MQRSIVLDVVEKSPHAFVGSLLRDEREVPCPSSILKRIDVEIQIVLGWEESNEGFGIVPGGP